MSNSESVDPVIQRWIDRILIVGLLGYPMIGTMIAVTSFSSLVASIPVRLFVAIASIFVILESRPTRFTLSMSAMVLFWYIYLARLVWDSVFVALDGAGEALLFFSTTCLLPAVALMRGRFQYRDEGMLARMMFWIGLVTCTLAVGFTLLGVAGDRSILAETGRLGFTNVNPITYGHVAASTILAAITLWYRRYRDIGLGVILFALIVAGTTLQLSGSRGPAICLMICLILLAVFQRRLRLIVLIVVVLASVAMTLGGNALEDRFTRVEDDPSTVERLLVQSNAINQFIESPIVGSAYIERELQIYPHNPFIESAMATGVLGLILFGSIFFAMCLKVVWWLRAGKILLPALVLQYSIASLLSGSLFLSTPLWMVFAIILPVTRLPQADRRVNI